MQLDIIPERIKPMAPQSLNNLSPTQLKSYIARGIISAVQTQPIPHKIEQMPEYKKNAKLKGRGIGIAEAGRKYSIPFPTISRWVKRGFIPVIGKVGKQKLLIDESYIAYCAEVYKNNSGQGKTIFNSDGTPFIPKTARS
jgi:hypothetical protein